MRWAVQGTADATRDARCGKNSWNLSGGYHHASADSAEGFCVYNDIGIAVYHYEWLPVVILIVFITFILPFYLEARVFTAPQFLEKRYDHRAKLIFSGFLLLANIFIDAVAFTPDAAGLGCGAAMARHFFGRADRRALFLVHQPVHHRGGMVVTHKIYRRIQKKVALIQIFMQKETSWKWGAQRQIWRPIF
jgi:hypothetical protein